MTKHTPRKYTETDRQASGKRAEQNKARRMIQNIRKKKGQRPLSGRFHVDHIKPLSKGGTNALSNLQVLPAKVNMQKGNKINFRKKHKQKK